MKERIRELLADEEVYALQAGRFDRLYGEPQDRHSWDLPWLFTRLVHAGLIIVPSVNLVDNIGNVDGPGLPPDHPLASLEVEPLGFPLRSPDAVAADREYDRFHTQRLFEWFQLQDSANAPARLRSRTMSATL